MAPSRARLSTTPTTDRWSLPVARRWLDAAPTLAAEFRDAEPFPHLVLDDFLDAELAQRLHDEFPAADAMPKSRDYVFGRKRELSSVEASGTAGAAFHRAVTSPEFSQLLGALTGYDAFVDPRFHGGGFHLASDGGFLDLHVDFNVHPGHDDWLRVLNVLLYLNHDWKPDYGGQLLIKATPQAQAVAIEPAGGRRSPKSPRPSPTTAATQGNARA